MHVHVCDKDSPWERERLAFRDFLRTHPEAAAAYAALKQGLAAEFGGDRGAYTDGKTAFIQGVIATATGHSDGACAGNS